LQAKADLAPKIFATESQFRPQYTALDLQNLNQTLQGAPGGTRQLDYTEMVTKYRNPNTGELSDTPRTTAAATLPNGRPAGGAIDWEPIQVPMSRSRTVNDPAQPGLLAIGEDIARRAARVDSEALSAQREADIADVGKLGGLSLTAQQQADPRTAALIEQLTSEASDELGMGYDMTPEQMRLAQQTIRARQQGTLGSIGPSGDLKEAIGVSKYAQDLRDRRRQFATGAVGLRQAVYGDSFNRVLGRPAGTNPNQNIGQAYGISQAGGPRMFGSTVNANDVYSSNQNAAAANAAAKQAQAQTYAGAGIGAGAGILAALI
jgi:hypothetical protein